MVVEPAIGEHVQDTGRLITQPRVQPSGIGVPAADTDANLRHPAAGHLLLGRGHDRRTGAAATELRTDLQVVHLDAARESGSCVLAGTPAPLDECPAQRFAAVPSDQERRGPDIEELTG
jgi:hypothetical protein